MRNLGLILLAALGFAGCDPNNSNFNSCIAAGTAVATPDGDVAIENVSVGDVIYSFDPSADRLVPTRVVAIRKAVRACIRLETRAGRWIHATPDHPFLSADGGYHSACSVARVGTVSGKDDVVRRTRLRGRFTVYDLTVESELHNFVAAGFVVHNKPPPLSGVVLVNSSEGNPGSPGGDFALIEILDPDSGEVVQEEHPMTPPGEYHLLMLPPGAYEVRVTYEDGPASAYDPVGPIVVPASGTVTVVVSY